MFSIILWLRCFQDERLDGYYIFQLSAKISQVTKFMYSVYGLIQLLKIFLFCQTFPGEINNPYFNIQETEGTFTIIIINIIKIIKFLKGDVAGEKGSIKLKAIYKEYVRLILQRCLHMCTGFLTQWAERLRTVHNEHALYVYKYITFTSMHSIST